MENSDTEKQTGEPRQNEIRTKKIRPQKIKPRKVQFRWSDEKDAILVTDVENLKPFLETGRLATDLWGKVAAVIKNNFIGDVDYLGVKRRFTLLMTDFKKSDSKDRYK
jgi:hypothetical protein